MKTTITINDRRHSLNIIPVVSPDAPDSHVGIEARGDGKPQKLYIRAGMTPMDNATAAGHLVSTLWLMNAGIASMGHPRSGQVKVGTTRYRLEITSRERCSYFVDPEKRAIRIEKGTTLQVIGRAAAACNLAWQQLIG